MFPQPLLVMGSLWDLINGDNTDFTSFVSTYITQTLSLLQAPPRASWESQECLTNSQELSSHSLPVLSFQQGPLL